MGEYIIKNGIIVLEDSILHGYSIIVRKNIIINILESPALGHSEYKNFEDIDAQNGYITPGLIEMHIHGCGPYDFASIPVESFIKASEFLSCRGINTFVPTFQYNRNYLRNLHSAMGTDSVLSDSIPGYYLEGPFISREKRGGILDGNISHTNIELLGKIIKESQGFLKIMTLAPEIENFDLVFESLLKDGIIPALGHSNCSLKEVSHLAEYSSKLVITHMYNAMSGISHKISGLAMYPFIYNNCFTELNGDGIHLSEEILSFSYKHLNGDKLILISDAVISAGSDFGEWEYCGVPVKSDRTGVRHKEGGTLVGSNMLLPEIIERFIRITGAPVYEAVKFATLNPARLLGIDVDRGSIKKGKSSDLVIFDKNFKVIRNLKGY